VTRKLSKIFVSVFVRRSTSGLGAVGVEWGKSSGAGGRSGWMIRGTHHYNPSILFPGRRKMPISGHPLSIADLIDTFTSDIYDAELNWNIDQFRSHPNSFSPTSGRCVLLCGRPAYTPSPLNTLRVFCGAVHAYSAALGFNMNAVSSFDSHRVSTKSASPPAIPRLNTRHQSAPCSTLQNVFTSSRIVRSD
jgi:hypothetical protein